MCVYGLLKTIHQAFQTLCSSRSVKLVCASFFLIFWCFCCCGCYCLHASLSHSHTSSEYTFLSHAPAFYDTPLVDWCQILFLCIKKVSALIPFKGNNVLYVLLCTTVTLSSRSKCLKWNRVYVSTCSRVRINISKSHQAVDQHSTSKLISGIVY